MPPPAAAASKATDTRVSFETCACGRPAAGARRSFVGCVQVFLPKTKIGPGAAGGPPRFCGIYVTLADGAGFFVLAMKPSAAALVCGLVWTRGLIFG